MTNVSIFGRAVRLLSQRSIVVVDGLFSQADDGALRFHAATSLGSRNVERLSSRELRRVAEDHQLLGLIGIKA